MSTLRYTCTRGQDQDLRLAIQDQWFSGIFFLSAFRKLLSIKVFSYFPFGFEGRMWDLLVSVPDHCLSFYFDYT